MVVSAGLYAGYTVVMRKRMPGEEAEEQVALFFGYVGLFSTVGGGRLVGGSLGGVGCPEVERWGEGDLGEGAEEF